MYREGHVQAQMAKKTTHVEVDVMLITLTLSPLHAPVRQQVIHSARARDVLVLRAGYHIIYWFVEQQAEGEAGIQGLPIQGHILWGHEAGVCVYILW